MTDSVGSSAQAVIDRLADCIGDYGTHIHVLCGNYCPQALTD